MDFLWTEATLYPIIINILNEAQVASLYFLQSIFLNDSHMLYNVSKTSRTIQRCFDINLPNEKAPYTTTKKLSTAKYVKNLTFCVIDIRQTSCISAVQSLLYLHSLMFLLKLEDAYINLCGFPG